MSTLQTTRETPAAPFPIIEGDHWIEKLNDGTPVLIRPIRPEDRERERAFIARLSPQARHYRFLGSMREASPELLEQLLDTDNDRRVAYVALAHDNGVLREVGVSRYSATDDSKHCEFAVTVADDWRHRGLAVVLMQHLIDRARRHGFKQMFSIDSAENTQMQELAHFLGFKRARDPDDSAQVIHTLDL